jgi:hypothetical protein
MGVPQISDQPGRWLARAKTPTREVSTPRGDARVETSLVGVFQGMLKFGMIHGASRAKQTDCESYSSERSSRTTKEFTSQGVF